MDRKTRVLFVGEAVTLAHVARPATLAAGLDPDRFDPVLASDQRYRSLLGDLPFPFRVIKSMPSEEFLDRLTSGRPVFDERTVRRQVADDIALIREEAPDVVVGDFRVSLSISARILGVPYVNLIDAHWSPHARRSFPVPDMPVTRLLGSRVAGALFRVARPIAFAQHTRGINAVRREHRMPEVGGDLARAYTDADYVAYTSVPELMPMAQLPSSHSFIGPVCWSPQIPLPSWWETLPEDRPNVYVCLGSSGRSDQLPMVLRALGDLPVNVLAATAGRVSADEAPDNVYVAKYLPGEAAAARSELVVCNGGSASTHQALSQGTPVLGIATNMDQLMNVEAIQGTGAGRRIPAWELRPSDVRRSVMELLEDSSVKTAATDLARAFTDFQGQARFRALIERVAHRELYRASVFPSLAERAGPAPRLRPDTATDLVRHALSAVESAP